MTRLRYVWLASTLCLLLAACGGPAGSGPYPSGTAALSLSAGKALAAIGMEPPERNGIGAEDAAWRDRRMAFGLTHLLAESFYATGKFRLVEEKDLHQRQLIGELVDLFWSASRPQLSDRELGGIGARLEAELLAYGRVRYARASGQRVQIGPLGRYQQRLRVTVEVCLFEVLRHTSLCREGEGEARQEGVGVVYEFRDDRPDFEKSAAGRAIKQAVTAAVQALMVSVRFAP